MQNKIDAIAKKFSIFTGFITIGGWYLLIFFPSEGSEFREYGPRIHVSEFEKQFCRLCVVSTNAEIRNGGHEFRAMKEQIFSY